MTRDDQIEMSSAEMASGERTRLRVAVVLGTATGGTARHAGLLAEGSRRAGLGVIALGPASARAAFRAGAAALPPPAGPDNAVTVYHEVEIAARPSPARDARAVARLRGLLRRARPDVVHAHGLRAGAFAALAMTPQRRGIRPALVVTVHNAPPQGRAAGLVYGGLELICARRADAVLCVSPDLARRMRRLGVRDVGQAVVPAPAGPPPSPDAVAKAAADLAAADRPVVLAVGRLARQKGYDILLAAAVHWQRRDRVPLLAIAGAGPLAGELAAEASRSGVDLRLLGQRDDVAALLAAADVIVVPSRWEGQPLIVQESLRAGRPLVASRVGGIPGLTGEDGAVLVPPGDAARLAEAVSEVLDDPARAARLSAAARVRAAELPTTADAVAAALATYRRLVPAP